jgi:hypothetical protein
LVKGAKGEHAIDGSDEGEEGRPHKEERVCKGDIVVGDPTANALNDVAAMTVNNDV